MTKLLPFQLFFAAVALVVPAAASVASDGYTAYPIDPSKPWWAILYTVVALAGIGVVAGKNARRTHLD